MLKRRHVLQEGTHPGRACRAQGSSAARPAPRTRGTAGGCGHAWGWALGALARRSPCQQHSRAVRRAQQEFYVKNTGKPSDVGTIFCSSLCCVRFEGWRGRATAGQPWHRAAGPRVPRLGSCCSVGAEGQGVRAGVGLASCGGRRAPTSLC